MEYLIATEKQERAVERIALLFISIYDLQMIYAGTLKGWAIWAVMFVGLSLVSSWILYIRKYRSYTVRALICTLLMQICLILHYLHSTSFLNNIPTFMVIGAVVALYGITDLVVISNVVQIFLIILFLVTGRQTMGAEEFTNTIPQIGNILFYLVVIHLWVRKRSDINEASMDIIKDMTKAERSKDDFLANISHEIRTPLNTIYGMSQMAQKQDDINVIKEEIYNIEVASKRLTSMVNDIMDFSELQAGEIDLEEEVYNISSTLNDIINMAMAAVADKDLDVIVDFDSTMPSLLNGDEKKIRRIIMNLVNNAVKFTSSGYIEIKVSCRRESYGMNLAVAVTDTGIGMKEDYVDKLFSGFGQLDTRRNRQEGGVGLGLAISSLLAKKLGGVITVSSKYGQGSTFTLVVPQKIVKDQPVVVIKNPENIKVAYYFDLEKEARLDARDAYQNQVKNIVKNQPVVWHACRNIDELKRRVENEGFSHIFITNVEYAEDPQYFDMMSEKIKVMVIVPRNETVVGKYGNAMVLYRPVYSLPIAAALNGEYDSAHMEKPIKSKKFTAPTAHVLVVDDNLMNIRVVENILSQFKISVTHALSGSEALEKVESMDYDFIFMDHMMPEMDGVETTHRIREKVGSYYQRVPIIALTANAVAGSRKMFLSEGFSDFVEKPVEMSVLERVLRRTLPVEKMIFTDPAVSEDVRATKVLSTEKAKQSNNVKELAVANNQHESDAESETGYNKEADTISNKSTGKSSANASYAEAEIDKKTGVMYCGGEDGFYMILSECVLGCSENAAELKSLFEKKDWTNYIIKIHALKSTMKSIGAMNLSDRAKELEFAGKDGKYEIIEQKHAAVIRDYEELMKSAAKIPEVAVLLPEDKVAQASETDNTAVEAVQDLPEMTEKFFQELYARFEDAMYSLKKDEMTALVDELMHYRFENKEVSNGIEKIRRKIAQDDFFAAGADFEALKEFVKGGN